MAQSPAVRSRNHYLRHTERRKEQARKYRLLHPEAVRKWVRRGARKRRMGITEDYVTEQLKNQKYQCGICASPVTEASHVDHNHLTGKPRGILCKPCNLALGGFGDSVDRLTEAALYLRIWQ